MPYAPYKLLHFLGLFTMLVLLSSTSAHVLRGGTWPTLSHRGWRIGLHVISALLVLVGGFGMLARLGFMHGQLPAWVFVKLGLWAVLSASLALPFLGRGFARALVFSLPVLSLAAAAIALYKPF